MAYTTINKSTEHFNTKLYTGTGSSHAITGVGFQPDWVWIKSRSLSNEDHKLHDSVRGTNGGYYESLRSNSDVASDVVTDGSADNTGMSAIGSDGFTVVSNGSHNQSSATYASWNWKAGGGQGSSNTDGSINTTHTSVNTTAGFSISTYTGNATAGATIGHGLGTTPSMIMVKNRSATGSWRVYHKSLGANYLIQLNLTSAALDNTTWNDTAPTSSVFTINSTSDVNASGNEFVAYCFAEKTGYSKFGSYVGNANADATFIYTGFKPAFVMIKNTEASEHWRIYDNKRDPFNHMFRNLKPNANSAENTTDNASEEIDFVSNGIKIRSNSQQLNGSGQNLIYMAFGQSLVGSNNVPCTAR